MHVSSTKIHKHPQHHEDPSAGTLALFINFFYFLSSSLIFILMILNFHYALQAP